jgi:hypothetical protein
MTFGCAARVRLFQLDKQQDENCPHSHGYWKLCQGGIPQRPASWQGIGERKHRDSREYSQNQLTLPCHIDPRFRGRPSGVQMIAKHASGNQYAVATAGRRWQDLLELLERQKLIIADLSRAAPEEAEPRATASPVPRPFSRKDPGSVLRESRSERIGVQGGAGRDAGGASGMARTARSGAEPVTLALAWLSSSDARQDAPHFLGRN